VMTMQYTARNGGTALRSAANTAIEGLLDAMRTGIPTASDTNWQTPLTDLIDEDLGCRAGFSVAHDFPDAWHQFLNNPDEQASDPGDVVHSMTLELTEEMFPQLHVDQGIKISSVDFVLILDDTDLHSSVSMEVNTSLGGSVTMSNADPLFGLPHGSYPGTPPLDVEVSPVTVEMTVDQLNALNTSQDVLVDETTTPPRLVPGEFTDIIVVVRYDLSTV